MNKPTEHIPVLAEEVVKYANVDLGENKIIDGTVGYGGHSKLLLSQNSKNSLLGIDRDVNALSFTSKRLEFAKDRVFLRNGNYSDFAEIAKEIGWNSVNTILLDIGISSPQIDNGDRGFAHRLEGPLDMRMNVKNPITASRIINTAPFEELNRIFREYGEIRSSKRLANEIIAARKIKPFTTTSELKQICEDVLGKPRRGTLPKSTLCFQALRIEVNDELNELRRGIETGIKLLAKGGRLLIISFHSLEDRIVKDMFRTAATECVCPPGLPLCICEHKKELKLITKKPVVASKEEINVNRRSACAKLRVAEKE